MDEKTKAEIQSGIDENVRRGFMVRNPNGTYSVTPAGAAHMESLRKKPQHKWETMYSQYHDIYDIELLVLPSHVNAGKWQFIVIEQPDENTIHYSDPNYPDAESAMYDAEQWFAAKYES